MAIPGKRVLVVDDETEIRLLLHRVLSDGGFEVEEAKDGLDALEKIQARRPDLVTLDLHMPRLDGWGVLERLREMESPPPVVVISGQREKHGPIHPPIAAFLWKPFRLDVLLSTCRKVCETPVDAPASDRRRETRRNLIVEVAAVTSGGTAVAVGNVVNLSESGARVEGSFPWESGQTVRVSFRVPGDDEPVVLSGKVQWRAGQPPALSFGLDLGELPAEEARRLKEILG